jgi:hypothetical protein
MVKTVLVTRLGLEGLESLGGVIDKKVGVKIGVGALEIDTDVTVDVSGEDGAGGGGIELIGGVSEAGDDRRGAEVGADMLAELTEGGQDGSTGPPPREDGFSELAEGGQAEPEGQGSTKLGGEGGTALGADGHNVLVTSAGGSEDGVSKEATKLLALGADGGGGGAGTLGLDGALPIDVVDMLIRVVAA